MEESLRLRGSCFLVSSGPLERGMSILLRLRCRLPSRVKPEPEPELEQWELFIMIPGDSRSLSCRGSEAVISITGVMWWKTAFFMLFWNKILWCITAIDTLTNTKGCNLSYLLCCDWLRVINHCLDVCVCSPAHWQCCRVGCCFDSLTRWCCCCREHQIPECLPHSHQSDTPAHRHTLHHIQKVMCWAMNEENDHLKTTFTALPWCDTASLLLAQFNMQLTCFKHDLTHC